MDGDFGQSKGVQSLWARLWKEIYGEPPPLADDSQLLIRILVESLPPLPPYELGRKAPAEPEADAKDAAASG